jgi:RND family efflux transporter MFP subunit
MHPTPRSQAVRTGLSILGLLALGVPAWIWISSPPETPPQPAHVAGPTPIRTRTVTARRAELRVEAYGTLLPVRRARLAPEAGGRVAHVLEGWRPGRRVSAGQELLALEDVRARALVGAAEAAVREAEAALGLARAEEGLAPAVLEAAEARHAIAVRERERTSRLAEGGNASDSQADAAEAAEVAAGLEVERARAGLESAAGGVERAAGALAGAEASLTFAREDLARHRLVAPFDGELAGRAPAIGTYLAPGVPVCDVVDRARLHLVVQVPEDRIPDVRRGQSAWVSLPSRPGARSAARVTAVGVESDPSTRSLAVELDVDNGPSTEEASADAGVVRLAAGQFARAVIETGVSERAVLVERALLTWRDGDAVVHVVVEGGRGLVAERRVLALGDEVGEGFVVLDGLAEGDELIVWPTGTLVDAAPVERLPTPEPAR